MKKLSALVWLLLLGLSVFKATPTFAQPGAPTNLQLLDQALARVKPGDKFVSIDDMQFPVELFRRYRNTRPQPGTMTTRSAFQLVTLWPGGVVPYDFDAALPATTRAFFVAACHEWASEARLTFVARTTEKNYIYVSSNAANESNSPVGMQGGKQTLLLASWANKFTACHELAHALGVLHEQCRSDRDNYITINWNNIQKNQQHNYSKIDDSSNQGSYDFDSVMHYPSAGGFAINSSLNCITMLPAYASYQSTIGQRNHLSDLDAAGMAAKYGDRPYNNTFGRSKVAFYGPTAHIEGDNTWANKQDDEPNHANNGGGASVWFTWHPSKSDPVTFSTQGSSFDTTLAVYTGSSLKTLVKVAEDDDSGPNKTSRLTFNAVAGQTYSIALDSHFSAFGTGFVQIGFAHKGHYVLDVEETPRFNLSGKFTNAFRGPLSGLPIRLTSTGTTPAVTIIATRPDGTYSFPQILRGHYVVSAPAPSVPLSRAIDLTKDVLDADFIRPFTLSGQVTDEARMPVGNVMMSLTGLVPATTFTRADGTYSFAITAAGFSRLAPAFYEVTPVLFVGSYATPSSITRTMTGNISNVNFVITSTKLVIAGRVTDKYFTPLKGVIVVLSNSKGQRVTRTTSANGTYSFKDVPRGGTYNVQAFFNRSLLSPASLTFPSLKTSINNANFKSNFVVRPPFSDPSAHNQ